MYPIELIFEVVIVVDSRHISTSVYLVGFDMKYTQK